MANLKWVTIGKFSELTGYSEEAVRSKIKRGEWLERVMWVKAPDGRILLDMEAYEWWVTNGRAASGQLQIQASR